MISFTKFLSSYKKKFVCVYFNEATNKLLFDYATSNNLDLSVKYNDTKQDPKDFDFHITIFYSNTPTSIPNIDVDIPEFEVYCSHLSLFGNNKDILVVEIAPHPTLSTLNQLFYSLGMRSDFPDFKPHISLCYEKKDYDLSQFPEIDFPIVINRIGVYDID